VSEPAAGEKRLKHRDTEARGVEAPGKFETRNPKHETNSKYECSNAQNNLIFKYGV
jgi:hypothetical protein